MDKLRPLLQEVCHERAHLRVRTSFQDFDILSSVHMKASQAAHAARDARSKDQIRVLFESSARADALHRAAIEAAHRAMSVLLHECNGRPRREVNIMKQLRRPASVSFKQRECWQGLYCLAVFRNKIVVHNDVPRMFAAMTEADGTRRLVPMPEEFHISSSDGRRLREIQASTGIAEGIENHFELLEALFYRFPVTYGGDVTPERKEIDLIAERGGVKSPAVTEIGHWLANALADIERLLLDELQHER
jgi:hypothetical protein